MVGGADPLGGKRGMVAPSRLQQRISETKGIRITTSRKIGQMEVAIALGDMTALTEIQAWVVPHFDKGVSYGGVGAAVVRAGGEQGLREMESRINSMSFGEAAVTGAGRARVKNLIHVVSVGSGRDREFGVVQKATSSALKAAEEADIASLAFPALGTGVIGALTPHQSANAMLTAIRSHAAGKVAEVVIVIYGDATAYQSFADALAAVEEIVVDASKVGGQKRFDPRAWAAEVLGRDCEVGIAGKMTETEAERLGEQVIGELLRAADLPVDIQRFGRYVRASRGDKAEMNRIKRVIHPDVIQGHISRNYGALYEPEIIAAMLTHAGLCAAKYFSVIAQS